MRIPGVQSALARIFSWPGHVGIHRAFSKTLRSGVSSKEEDEVPKKFGVCPNWMSKGASLTPYCNYDCPCGLHITPSYSQMQQWIRIIFNKFPPNRKKLYFYIFERNSGIKHWTTAVLGCTSLLWHGLQCLLNQKAEIALHCGVPRERGFAWNFAVHL